MNIIYYSTLAIFILLILSYAHERRKMINGFLLNIFLLCSLLSLVALADATQNSFLINFLAILAVVLLFTMLFGVFIVMIVSFFNAIVLMHREGRRLSNMLTLFVGIGILLLLLLVYGGDLHTLLFPADYLLTLFFVSIFYFLFIFANFIVSSFLYSIYRPWLDKDYIIVLGSGLLDGYRVSPLLAKRIDRGLHLYHKQKAKKKQKHKLKIIMSGGQGGDELIPEALAMKTYALEQGIPEADILVEDQSKNTIENMANSKMIILNDFQGKRYKAIFSTSNYHVFRSGIYARKVGLKAQGVGAKTPFYFWYNALLREYIAVLMIYKKWHLAILIGIAIGLAGVFYVAYNPTSVPIIMDFLKSL